jgi:hypothetical protein
MAPRGNKALNLLSYLLYRFSYGVLLTVLIILLLITPADLIIKTFASPGPPGASEAAIRSLRVRIILVVVIISGAAAVVSLFIYSLRVWESRRLIASLPRDNVIRNHVKNKRLASEKGIKSKKEKDWEFMVRQCRERSAKIAFMGWPRPDTEAGQDVQHDGWSAPKSYIPAGDNHKANDAAAPKTNEALDETRFEDVVLELPNLIEAKAVSSVSPFSVSAATTPAAGNSGHADANKLEEQLEEDQLDREVLETALSRSRDQGLREYLAMLSDLGVLKTSPDLVITFLGQYEQARFSGVTLSLKEFETLMRLGGEILRGLSRLSTQEKIALLETLGSSDSFASRSTSRIGSSSVYASDPDPTSEFEVESFNGSVLANEAVIPSR